MEEPNVDPSRNTSDDALALDFTDLYHREIRYLGQINRWYTWNGVMWEMDHRLKVYTQARLFLRKMAHDLQRVTLDRLKAEIPKDLTADEASAALIEARGRSRRNTRHIQSSNTIHSTVKITRYDARISSMVEDWDADPWLLNTPAGTVNLKTGTMRTHRSSDYITKSTKVAPDFKMQPRIWLDFLHVILRGDKEMIRYLQKVFGYCLVGETKEHQMYFAYGTGQNGKGVTLQTFRELLGDYGMEAAIETFIINDSSRHPTELADLRGARLVTCGETEANTRWAEARIKMLTGGDPVKARFMRQDFFQYTPQFKLFIAGNHKPKLANVDEAIERRFRLIPFTYHVPDEDKDLDLRTKLIAEWPGILAWAISGCLAWQSEGLKPPEAVAGATKSYLNQEDVVRTWFVECCEPDAESYVSIKDLWASWASWATDSGAPIGSKRTLSGHLEDREPILHIQKVRRTDGIGFMGLRLLPDAVASE